MGGYAVFFMLPLIFLSVYGNIATCATWGNSWWNKPFLKSEGRAIFKRLKARFPQSRQTSSTVRGVQVWLVVRLLERSGIFHSLGRRWHFLLAPSHWLHEKFPFQVLTNYCYSLHWNNMWIEEYVFIYVDCSSPAVTPVAKFRYWYQHWLKFQP